MLFVWRDEREDQKYFSEPKLTELSYDFCEERKSQENQVFPPKQREHLAA